jgi:hypothetical protein
MGKAKPVLKAAALVSSVLIVGAFIGCRTGAITPFSKPTPPAETPQPTTTTPATPDSKPTFMSGTKSLFRGIATPPGQPLFPPANPTPPKPSE